MWAVALTGGLARLGTVGSLLLLLGLGSIARQRNQLRWGLLAAVPSLCLIMFRGPALIGEQHDRLFIFVVPAVLLITAGLIELATRSSRSAPKRLIGLATAVVGATLLMAAGNRLRDTRFPIAADAYDSFPRLIVEGFEPRKSKPNGPLWWFPGYHPGHLLDPLLDQSGQRWVDLAWNLGHPRISQRPMSIDERALARTKGESFTSRWLPNHPLSSMPVSGGSGADPYGESTPLYLEIDLSALLKADGLAIRRLGPGTTQFDLAGNPGPFRLEAVQFGPGEPIVDITLWKEYRSGHDAETAIVVMPRWDRPVPTEPPGNYSKTLRIQVPSNGFISVVAVLGETATPLSLIAALEWNVRLMSDGNLEIFGPFRL
jgi:hypothetical protein